MPSIVAEVKQVQPAPPTSELRICHFNDVYEVTQRAGVEPVGGAPRFAHLLHRLADEHAHDGPTLVLFSGDALSPSLMSTVTKGKHMAPVLNGMRVAAACLGNHDLDFGLHDFQQISAQTAFPWLCANVKERASGRPLGGCKEYVILTAGDWRVGVIGLVEEEWIATLATVEPSSVRYEDACDAAARVVPLLRGAEGCDLVVALTHMRVPNDLRLARAAAALGIDLLLGGHDHEYTVAGLTPHEDAPQAVVEELRGYGGGIVPLIKSGSDFRTLSLLSIRRHHDDDGTCDSVGDAGASCTNISAAGAPSVSGAPALPIGSARIGPSGRLCLTVRRYNVTSAEPEDGRMLATVTDFSGVLTRKLEQVIGVTRVPLDSRFEAIRTRETAIGNFVADLQVRRLL